MIVDIVQGAYAVFHTDIKVVCAVIGRSVNKTGTRIGSNVIAENHRNLTRIERMLQQQFFQRCAFYTADDFMTVNFCARQHTTN